MVGDDDEHLKCVAAATSCQLHASLQVAEDTTKDDENWVIQIPVGISWDVTVDALVINDDDEGAENAALLQVGRVYTVRLSQTAGATGQQNRDAVSNVLQMTGLAILSDLQMTAQAGDLATATARFTGHGDLSQYQEPAE